MRMKTKISSKGQVVIPKSVRNRYQWKPGTVLQIEETPQGVLLSPASHPTVSQEEVFGCLKDQITRKVTLEEMDSIIAKLAKKTVE